MTPQAFIAKWRDSALTERAGAQPHFEDLCALLGVEPPRIEGEYQYERGLTKTGSARQGWADVWKRGCFAWEYKQPNADLGAALRQLMLYTLALDNPPLLVVSDRKRIEIHTHFTGTPSEVHTILLDDIGRPESLQKLRWLFDAPERFRPALTTHAVTEAAAQRMGALAERLNARGNDPQATAHFLIQCVFCMFAEDARLLPQKLFETVLDKSNPDGAKAQARLAELFATMQKGGDFALETIPYFNGGLFETIAVPALATEDVVQLLDAARMRWNEIEPAILGTLFERGLNPDMRSQLGAHYTDPATILKLVRPVVEEPLLAEWQAIRAGIERLAPQFAYLKGRKKDEYRPNDARLEGQRLLGGFVERLQRYRVLDPACGSGNFLYLALKTLKDIEHRANLDAEALGLQRELGIVSGPANVLGIELNPYAAELARVTVWIGELQWMLAHGYEIRRSPILRPLDHIENRDAVLLRPSPAGGRGVGGEGKGKGTGAQTWPGPPAPLPADKLAFARELRRNQTDAESLVWRLLRNRQLKNSKFRRQHPVGKYILDFYCAEHGLAVELDGGQHDSSRAHDTVRDAWLASQGIRVLRFWNSQVLNETEAVLETIWMALPDGDEKTPSPPTPLPPTGEGGSEPDWPDADVIVGNPPFLGDKKMRAELGDDYTGALRRQYAGRVPGGADFVTYWFEKARARIEAGKAERAGLVATNSIRGGASRKVLDRILSTSLPQAGEGPGAREMRIFEAWSDEPWVNNGAAVRVSLVCFGARPASADGGAMLDGQPVAAIHADLTSGEGLSAVDLTQAGRLSECKNTAFIGGMKKGAFDIPGARAREWLATGGNPNSRPNSDVIKPWVNGLDITRRPQDQWIVDFGVNTSEAEAALYEMPFQHLLAHVKPERDKVRNSLEKKRWWLHARPAPDLRKAIAGLPRFIGTARVAKHRLFVWLRPSVVCDGQVVVIARADDATFGILHSRFHELWSLRMGTWLGKGNDPRYTPTTTFETFPFPEGLTPRDTARAAERASPTCLAGTVQAENIAAAARHLNGLREAWLNPPEWTDWARTQEEAAAGFPPRPVAKPGHEAELKKRTLTNLYNARPAWLDHAHRDLDAAVAAAYGWADYTAETPDEEILRRLLALNLERFRMA
jgi:very-short-patch-repair endonuclease